MIWFTSDPHYWHKNVLTYCNRPFSSVEEMNEGLIENWNSVVGAKDTTFILGDFAFSGVVKAKEILRRLNGVKYLVMGNHDWHNKAHKWEEIGFSIFDETKTQDHIVIGNEFVTLSHFPYKGHMHDERYFEKAPEDQGGWLLHGHVHKAWKVKNKMINVGVDVWDYKPVSLEEIKEIIQKP